MIKNEDEGNLLSDLYSTTEIEQIKKDALLISKKTFEVTQRLIFIGQQKVVSKEDKQYVEMAKARFMDDELNSD